MLRVMHRESPNLRGPWLAKHPRLAQGAAMLVSSFPPPLRPVNRCRNKTLPNSPSRPASPRLDANAAVPQSSDAAPATTHLRSRTQFVSPPAVTHGFVFL